MDIYIYTIRLNSRTTPNQKGEDQTDTYIYTKGEVQTDTYIYIHVLRGKIRRTHIYTIILNNMILESKGGRSDGQIYIYYKIEQHDSSKAKGEDQMDTYIY